MSKAISTNLRCNHQIRISPVRLIDQDNNQLGVVDTAQAMRLAQEAGLDLVEVAPRERPPVCRIMDYGKFKYNQKKHQKRTHEQQLKEVRIRPKTDDNDRAIKMNRALKFLSHNDKVQFTMQFRGRERAHREVGVAILHGIARELGPLVKLERPPSMDGRHMVMIVAPVKPEFEKLAKAGLKANIEDVTKWRESHGPAAAPSRPAPRRMSAAPPAGAAPAGPPGAAPPGPAAEPAREPAADSAPEPAAESAPEPAGQSRQG